MSEQPIEERTLKTVGKRKITLEVALKEAERCRGYREPILNEVVIIVLADEVLRLRKGT